jgi:hypothetical protein
MVDSLQQRHEILAEEDNIDVEEHEGRGEFLGGDTREAGLEACQRVIDAYRRAHPERQTGYLSRRR